MTDQVERILWCPDCMSKHSRDLLHHAEAREDSELKKIAQKAFDISSKMLGVKDKKLYSEIRDLEHHTEDLLTGLRTERKKLTKNDCPECGEMKKVIERIKRAKPLNRESNKISNSIQGKEIHMSLKPLIGSFVGKGISEVTTRFVPGATFGVANKTLINLGIGIVVNALSVMKKEHMMGRAGEYIVPAANFLLADEVGDLVAGYIPAAPAAVVPAAMPTVGVAAMVPQFQNSKHVFVD